MQPPLPPFSTAPGDDQLRRDTLAAFPHAPGQLGGAIHDQLRLQGALVPQVVQPQHDSAPRMRPKPCRDPLAWSLLKHAVQLALVGAVVWFVLRGGDEPWLAVSYVATALLLVVSIAVADRMRFEDRDPSFEIVEFLAPEPAPAAYAPAAVPGPAPLTPIVEQMHAVLGSRLDVT